MKSPIISEFYVKVAQLYPLIRVVEAMQVDSYIFNDNTDDFVHSFNTDESKEIEVTENLILLESVQDAFAPATHQGNIGSNGFMALST